ncbi:MAG: hypothetical protein RLY58_1821 [Pseudomonadota bacterium]|jgi:acetyl esterase/lipase
MAQQTHTRCITAALLLSLCTLSHAGLRDRILEHITESRVSPLVSTATLTITHNIAYGNDPLQQLDLYQPTAMLNTPRTPKKHPVQAPWIVLVHGGAWQLGDKRSDDVVTHKVQHWVTQGIVVVSVNYRLLPKADPLSQAHDVAQALAFVQKNAASYGLDPSQCVLMGHSSGAHLAALLSVSPTIRQAHTPTPCQAAVLIDSAAMNIPQIMQRRHARFFDAAFGTDPSQWLAMSPVQQMTRQTLPLFTICTTRHDDSCNQNQQLVDQAITYKVLAQRLTLPVSHAEANELLGLDSPYTAAVDQFLSKTSTVFQHYLQTPASTP